jgi:hypothetical protein
VSWSPSPSDRAAARQRALAGEEADLPAQLPTRRRQQRVQPFLQAAGAASDGEQVQRRRRTQQRREQTDLRWTLSLHLPTPAVEEVPLVAALQQPGCQQRLRQRTERGRDPGAGKVVGGEVDTKHYGPLSLTASFDRRDPASTGIVASLFGAGNTPVTCSFWSAVKGLARPARRGHTRGGQPTATVNHFLCPGGTEGQQDHVAGHVGGEDPTQPEVAGGIDQARDQGEQRQCQQQRLDPWRGVRTLRAGLHRRTLSADRWRPGVRVVLATWC